MQNALREIETEAYRATLDLADIEIAETCDVCPMAPPTTKLQAHLIVLADVLEQQATLARECAQPSVAVKVEHNGRNGHEGVTAHDQAHGSMWYTHFTCREASEELLSYFWEVV